jgi:lipoprotein-releasing system ATP-binding protein
MSERTPNLVLEGIGLSKVYRQDDGSELPILEGVDIEVRRGEAIAVVGASGAGKSTLLHLLGCLDRPTTGEVYVEGQSIRWAAEDPERDYGGGLRLLAGGWVRSLRIALTELVLAPRELGRSRELAAIRNRSIGFVFQFHHLLREFTALENVMMPMLIAGRAKEEARAMALALLEEVGLGSRVTHKTTELSGGEQQRVAVARALVNRPAVVLADEPSGNLDTHTSLQLHDLFFRLREEHGVALVLATHNHELASRTDRVLEVRDGTLRQVTRAG